MGSELVESPPPSKGGEQASLSLSELFDKALPQYMAIGMSAEEFWDGDPYLVKAYESAFRIKKDLQNQNMWRMGQYVYSALCSASPLFALSPVEPMPYMDAPIPLTQEQVEEQEEERARIEFENNKARFMNQMNLINKNKEVNNGDK